MVEMADAAEPRYPVRIVRNARIPLPGGDVTLAADLYLPDGAPARPALLMIGPYLKDGVAGSAYWYFNHDFASRGYPVVLADLRGIGGSGGLPRPAFDPGDADDGVAAVAWTARQPWCDGRVGLWGASYVGITALRTAAVRPPALKACFVVEIGLDAERDFIHPDGVRGGMSPLGLWPLGDLVMQLLPPLHADAAGDWERLWAERLPKLEPRLLDLVRQGPGHATWRRRLVDASRIEVPTFVVGGWRDFLCGGTLAAYAALRGPRKLLMGPWMHLQPDLAPVAPVDLQRLALRWWNRWLLDEDNGVEREPAVTSFVQGSNVWRTSATWPPPGSVLDLVTSEGRLRDRDDQDSTACSGTTAITVDPATGFRSGLWGFPIPGLPHDGREDDAQGIAFTGAPLPAAIELAGAPQARIVLGACEGVRRIVARLSHVDPQGRSFLVTSGCTTVAPSVAQAVSTTVDLTDTHVAIPAGHRLRLTIDTGDFPRLWPDPSAKVLAVRYGTIAGTSIRVPVVPPAMPGETIELAAHAPGTPLMALALSLAPEWNVSHDLLTASVTLTLGQRGATHTPQREAVLEMATRVQATISRFAPDLADVRGEASATVRRPQGGEIVAHASVRVTADGATASGRVTVDGVERFTREWHSRPQ